MKRYLTTLACSGLLSIGTLCGTAAFAASIPGSGPDTAPAVVGEAIHPLLMNPSDNAASGMQLVRGGGGGGGGGGGIEHGGGGFHGDGGFHGMNGPRGMGGFHDGHHFRGRGFDDDDDGGGAFFGFGVYPYCNPYYGPCYPGYYPGY